MKNYKKQIRNGIIILLTFFLMGWCVWGIMACVGNLNDNVYPFDKANSQFNRAYGTNNLNNFAEFTEYGLAIFDDHSGNEAWWYPTINTDMDSIKDDIQIIIDNAKLIINTTSYGSDAYQEALDNAKESLSIQMDRLYACKWLFMGSGKRYIGLFWGWMGVLTATIILICIFASIDTYKHKY